MTLEGVLRGAWKVGDTFYDNQVRACWRAELAGVNEPSKADF